MSRFDKHAYYTRSVQDPDGTLAFVRRVYNQAFGRQPVCFGEDFCGTFVFSREWVRSQTGATAIAVDLDRPTLLYGLHHHFCQLTAEEQKRLLLYECDVRDPRLPTVDVIGAFNFSYFIFHQRKDLLGYLRNCRRRLGKKGMLILDCFGGSETQQPNEEFTRHGDFIYYWQQVGFDPLTHRAKFYIHFRRRGEKKRLRAFTYDWRMWTLPELTELLGEAGFAHTQVYWETTGPDGTGSGIFRKKNPPAENEAAWVVYITAH